MSPVDYQALFEAGPNPYLILDPGLLIVAVNDAYLRATMTERDAIVGHDLFDVFPDPPDDPRADGVAKLTASLERVRGLKRPDRMAIQKYPVRDQDGNFEERHWSPLNVPVFGIDGEIDWILHYVEDVTDLIRLRARHAATEHSLKITVKVVIPALVLTLCVFVAVFMALALGGVH